MDTHLSKKLDLLNPLNSSIQILLEKSKSIGDSSDKDAIDWIMCKYQKSLEKLSLNLSDYINFRGVYERSDGKIMKEGVWVSITTDEDREKYRYTHFKCTSESLIYDDCTTCHYHYKFFKGTDPHLYFNMFISLVQAFFHIFDFSNETKHPDEYWFKHKNSLFRARESFVKNVANLVKEYKEMVAKVDELQSSSTKLTH